MEDPYNIGKLDIKSKKYDRHEKNGKDELKDIQFYLITLEDNRGENQQLKIFKDSDADEIAFNFCKENNLDYKSMKYIKKIIKKILEKFDVPNQKIFFLDNSYSSIKEVDEENSVSENNLLNNEVIKEKNCNKNIIKEIKFQNQNIKDNKGFITKKNKDKKKDTKMSEENKNQETNEIKDNNNSLKNVGNINKENKHNKNNIEKMQKPKTINDSRKNQKSKNFMKIDLNLLKAKMNDIRLKNSVLNVKTERNIEETNKDNEVQDIYYKFKNKKNNKKLKKSKLLKNELNSDKISEILKRNILYNHIKNFREKQCLKSPNIKVKNKENCIINKTFTDNYNKLFLQNNKVREFHKIKTNNYIIVPHKTTLFNNNNTIQAMPFVEKEFLQFHSTRLTPKKTKKNLFIPPKQKSKPENISKQKEINNLNLSNKLQNNEYFFSKIILNKFKLN